MSGRLQFFNGSKDALPCKGTGEAGDPNDFLELSKIRDWRRVLSNFYVVPEGIFYNGLHWNTVEHAFQGMKFVHHPHLYNLLSLESGSDISREGGLSARKMRKAYMLNYLELQDWDQRKGDIMKDLWREKFSKDPLAKKVLLATWDAELWHSTPRTAAERWFALEEIRNEIRSSSS